MELEKEEEKILGETVLSRLIYPTYDRSASPFVPTAAIHTHEFFLCFLGSPCEKDEIRISGKGLCRYSRVWNVVAIYLRFPFPLVQLFIVFNHFMNCVCASKTVQPHEQ